MIMKLIHLYQILVLLMLWYIALYLTIAGDEMNDNLTTIAKQLEIDLKTPLDLPKPLDLKWKPLSTK